MKMTSIGNFMPTVCTALAGTSHSASSGARCFLRKRPSKRVRNVSAFLIFVASQVLLSRFVTGILALEGSKQLHNVNRYRSEDNEEKRRQHEYRDREHQLDDRFPGAFFGFLRPLLPHCIGIDS